MTTWRSLIDSWRPSARLALGPTSTEASLAGGTVIVWHFDQLSKRIEIPKVLEVGIVARLGADLGADCNGPFEQGQGAFGRSSSRLDRRKQIQGEVVLGHVGEDTACQAFSRRV